MMTLEEIEVLLLELQTTVAENKTDSRVKDVDLLSEIVALDTRVAAIEAQQVVDSNRMDNIERAVQINRTQTINNKDRIVVTRVRLIEVESLEGRIRASLEGKSSYKASRRLLNRSKHDRQRDD